MIRGILSRCRFHFSHVGSVVFATSLTDLETALTCPMQSRVTSSSFRIIVPHDFLFPLSTTHHVVNRSGILDSRFPRHRHPCLQLKLPWQYQESRPDPFCQKLMGSSTEERRKN